jgi:opacity protein-like surface antigen
VRNRLSNVAITASLLGLLNAPGAQAADPLGLYVGAGAGRSYLRTDGLEAYDSGHSSTQSGWTAYAGARPLPILGVELQYLDFGHAKWTQDFTKQRALRDESIAVFARPTFSLPFVDFYAKAGVGRLHSAATVLDAYPVACSTIPIQPCPLEHPQRTDSTHARFGYGAGLEVKLSHVAVRAEYVRFNVPGGDPDLLTVGLLWKF